MNAPIFDTNTTDKDTTGKVWVQALIGRGSRILAGRDTDGRFHCFTDNETLFDAAVASIVDANQRATDARDGEPA